MECPEGKARLQKEQVFPCTLHGSGARSPLWRRKLGNSQHLTSQVLSGTMDFSSVSDLSEEHGLQVQVPLHIPALEDLTILREAHGV